ncbi:LuxR C-terminal-related transcriptional regulator [Hyphomicrobium sp.]|uniref:helix-turn-helix transcriptional regulator n=1 Tax=Hyphomicrobium sp. TaxID=82 RepID=UPI0025BB2F52|nr:LuxR C-terminal-related transcriptional regulator [Hyphomicrobium sp.]MCC7253140.1 helix-turn-helix transcriptional regulator [Hyphomicrobium sp.]
MASDLSFPSALLDLVGEIYDSAIEPAKWTGALERLAATVNGCCAVVTVNPLDKGAFRLKAQWNVNPDHEDALRENFSANPILPSAWYYGVDEPFTAYAFGGPEYQHGDWYKTVQSAYGYGDSALAFLAKSKERFGSLAILREEHLGGFSAADVDVLRLLVPHVRRAAMIADLLEVRALESDTLSATLDHMRAGIILTDGTGRIAHANAAAQHHLEAATALRRDGDMLSARAPEAARDLARAIQSAASGTTVDIPSGGFVIPIGDARGSDLAAWVLPLDSGLRRDLGGSFEARVAVFVRALGDTSPFPAELFVRRYGITPAEARVMMLVTQGMTLAETAASLGISLPTAKTHLARLFEKTGTRRQAELVRLAMSVLSPAA